MKREILLKQMNDAIEMKQRIKTDLKLKQVYSDVDFDKFIRICRQKLGYEKEKIIENPVYEANGFIVINEGMTIPWN